MAAASVRIEDFVSSRYPPDQLVIAGPGRRLAGYLIEGAIWFFGILLGIITIGILLIPFFIGYLVWFIFAAINGQTPGKQLLGMYIMKADGTRAGGGYVWVRELLIKGLVTSLITMATFGIFWIVAALWCLWDRDRQCLWDKMASTYIAWSPRGYKPLTANELQLMGMARTVEPVVAPPSAVAPPPPPPLAAAPSPPNSQSVPDQLRQLARLHDEGIITDEEYESRRSELVKRL